MRRVHLVTGASSGIGAAVAQALHNRGDLLLLTARSPSRATELADRFPSAEILLADLADPQALETTLSTMALPEALDSVLHIAGVLELSRVESLTAYALRWQLDVNLVAPAVLTRACLPALRRRRGLILFVNSGAGLNAHPHYAAYSASKSGLRSLAHSLREEEATNGIRVSTIYPGRTATPMQQLAHLQEGEPYDQTRWIEPDTLAATILHLIDLPNDATVTDLVVMTRHIGRNRVTTRTEVLDG